MIWYDKFFCLLQRNYLLLLYARTKIELPNGPFEKPSAIFAIKISR